MQCICRNKFTSARAECLLFQHLAELAAPGAARVSPFDGRPLHCSRCPTARRSALKCRAGDLVVCCACYVPSTDRAQLAPARAGSPLPEPALGPRSSSQFLKSLADPFSEQTDIELAGKSLKSKTLSCQPPQTRALPAHSESPGEAFSPYGTVQLTQTQLHAEFFDFGPAQLVPRLQKLAADAARPLRPGRGGVVVDFRSLPGWQLGRLLKSVYKGRLVFWAVEGKCAENLELSIVDSVAVSSAEVRYLVDLQAESEAGPIDYAAFLRRQHAKVRARISDRLAALGDRVSADKSAPRESNCSSLADCKQFLEVMRQLHNFARVFARFHEVAEDLAGLFRYVGERRASCARLGEPFEKEGECGVCFNAARSDTIVYCAECLQGAHFCCLGLREPPEAFLCLGCESKRTGGTKTCFACKKSGYLLQASRNGNALHYHGLCVAAGKGWARLLDAQLRVNWTNLRNHVVCALCTPRTANKGEVVCCARCRAVFFHAMCGFLAGCHFQLEDLDKMTLDGFRRKEYAYTCAAFCRDCSLAFKARKSSGDASAAKRRRASLVQLNHYYRNAIVDNEFFKANPAPQFD